MSHDATAWAKAQKTGHGSTKLILLLLADYAGTDYSCYPSVKKLSELSELGESTVRSATKLLAELGLIRVFYRHRPDGSRRSSRYQLLVDGPDTDEPDADDWANRRILAVDMRQLPADPPPAASGPPRQDLAVIPTKEPSLVEPSPVTPGAKRTAKATRIPDDFFPDDSMRAWYQENIGASVNGIVEHERFCDYWRAVPGVRGQKVDWPATWRNWMRTASERAGRRPGTALAPTSGAPYVQNSTTNAKVMQTLGLAEKFRQMEEGQ